MFGLFKKKQSTAMDGVIRAIYGDHPPARSADLKRAITIAHEDLLAEQVPLSDVQQVASGLFAGPMPYSTHDLSVATALSFFKNPALLDHLKESQIGARLRALNWMKAGKVAPDVLKIFEDTLYRVYKPSPKAADGEREARFAAYQQQTDAHFLAFKTRNVGKTLHDAAQVVCHFIIWQHNSAELERPDDVTDNQQEHAQRIERALLMGAVGIAADAFSVSDANDTLFLMNVIGAYKGLGHGQVEDEILKMYEAYEVEEKAAKIGAWLMIDYLANGKEDENGLQLAALQKECWGTSIEEDHWWCANARK